MIREDVVIICNTAKTLINGKYEFIYLDTIRNDVPRRFIKNFLVPVYIQRDDELIENEKKYLLRDKYDLKLLEKKRKAITDAAKMTGYINEASFNAKYIHTNIRDYKLPDYLKEYFLSIPLIENTDVALLGTRAENLLQTGYTPKTLPDLEFSEEKIQQMKSRFKGDKFKEMYEYFKRSQHRQQNKNLYVKNIGDTTKLQLSYEQSVFYNSDDTFCVYTPIIDNDSISIQENYMINFKADRGFYIKLNTNNKILYESDTLITVYGKNLEIIVVEVNTINWIYKIKALISRAMSIFKT